MHRAVVIRHPLILFVIALGVAVTGARGQDSPATPRDTSFTTEGTLRTLLGAFPDLAPSSAVIPPEVAGPREEVYARIGSRELRLELFVPAENPRKQRPLVLLIHGGGWRSGDRRMEWPMAIKLARRGYAAATVEYRLSGEARYPAGVHDLKAAVRWLRAHATDLGIDGTRIAVMGGSAGGTLAALLGTTGDDPTFEGTVGVTGISSTVQAVVDVDGIVDFADPAESGKDDDPARPSAGCRWFGATFAVRPDLWNAASPLHHVTAQTPPVAFINSAEDRFHAGRDAMIATLRRHHLYYEVHVIGSTPHPFWLFEPWAETVAVLAARFLDTVLLPH